MKTPANSLSLLEDYILLSEKEKHKIWSRVECFEINIIEEIDDYLANKSYFGMIECLLDSIFLDLQHWFFINDPGTAPSKQIQISTWWMYYGWDSKHEDGVDVSKKIQDILLKIQEINIYEPSSDLILKSISSLFKELIVMIKSPLVVKEPLAPWLLLDLLLSKLLGLCLVVRIKETIDQ